MNAANPDHPAHRAANVSGVGAPGLRLYGKRVVLRPLNVQDFSAWAECRKRNGDWLLKWEPLRPITQPDPANDRDIFSARCNIRERERQSGTSYAFGLFVDNAFCGEVNLNNVVRGAMQTATIGYWIDERRAGNAFTSEAVVVLLKFAFDELHLHRIEICIIPRNTNSLRVVEKIGLRNEGLAERFLEINGLWEDHFRFAMTAEEWACRRGELSAEWLTPAGA
ncbi:MAG: GNAT family N-acetyltransferase [Ilumatobacteraceae bacterium]|nr:GNAT family N-acetyltransferase [Ilumatobacteraceae bacterium]